MNSLIICVYLLSLVLLYPLLYLSYGDFAKLDSPFQYTVAQTNSESEVRLQEVQPSNVHPQRVSTGEKPGSERTVDDIIAKMSGGASTRDRIIKQSLVQSNSGSSRVLPKREIGTTVFLYTECKKQQIDRYHSETPDTSKYDISIVTVGSLNRLFALPTFISRWDGPIILVFYLKEEQVDIFDQYLETSQGDLCSSRIQFVTYVAAKGSFFYSNYPINILRNLGIAHVRTSHFICLDMDMWMSYQSYQTLLKLPTSITSSTRTAVVIPAFFHTGWRIANGTLEEQVASVRSRIPFTMNELLSCVHSRQCASSKKGLFTHLYVPQKWISDKAEGKYEDYYNYTCWPNYLQEPYLLVYRNDSITKFNEAFINYGFNKISYVETLRREEYRFVLAGNIYAFDLPHLPSNLQKSHATNTKSGNYMVNYYYTQALVKRTKNNKHILKTCK